jgi:hypothetical protein
VNVDEEATMLTITYQHPAAGRASERAALDAVAFHESALTFGLDVATAADGISIRVTGDPRDLAALYADLKASGNVHVTVSRGQGDRGAEDVFPAALDELGIEVEVARILS